MTPPRTVQSGTGSHLLVLGLLADGAGAVLAAATGLVLDGPLLGLLPGRALTCATLCLCLALGPIAARTCPINQRCTYVP